MGSLTLFRIWGIPVRLHASFVLGALVLVAWRGWTGGLSAALLALQLGMLLFGSVLLHELGHALVGRSFGVPTRDITLYPFGGVAAMKLEARNSRAELWIALAGPSVNALLALAAWGGMALGARGLWPVVLLNAAMGMFNLIPAYPMDGGRVLRALWAGRYGLIDATLRAITVSRVFAWGFLLLSLTGRPSLSLVGGFLLLATGAERRQWLEMARRLEAARRWGGAPFWAPAGGPFGWRGPRAWPLHEDGDGRD